MQWLSASADKIGQLFINFDNYQLNHWNEVNYNFFPYGNAYEPLYKRTFNSNSYAHSLLQSVGLYPTKPLQNVPGWDQIIPLRYFTDHRCPITSRWGA